MVPLMAKATWPNDHESKTVGTGIDWRAASPLAFRAPIAVWKRVAQQDALRLRDDPKYSPILKTLPEEVQAVIHEIADAVAKKREAEASEANKGTILAEIDQAIKEAEDGDDITAKLRGLELKAKLHQLLNPKTQEDQVVNIYVVTGVNR